MSRSSKAVVIFASPKTVAHSEKLRLVVGEFDGGEHDLLVMLEDQGQDLHHLAVTARPLEQMLLQGPERRRHLGEGRAVAQGAGLALDHGQIMPPVIEGPALAIMDASGRSSMGR